jgi:hypothetical protein
MTLTCKACGKPAELINGEVYRVCSHHTEGVAAECSATCYGDGGVEELSAGRKLAALIRRIVDLIKR